MKISVKFGLVPGSSSDLPIRMRIGYAGLRLDLRTGFVCPPEKWDSDQMRMRSGTSNRYRETAATINRELSRQESLITQMLARYELDGVVPEPAVLKNDFDIKMGRAVKGGGTYLSLESAFDMYLSDSSFHLASATIHSYTTTLNRVKEFPFSELPLDDLTDAHLSKFINDLWDSGLENQSVSNYLTQVRTILRYAKTKGFYHGDLYESFKPTFKGIGKKDIHYLEWEEFKSLLYVQLVSPLRTAVRDAFCFCCATGLRVSDCAALRWSNVHLDCEVPYISLVAKKTTKPTHIELNQFSRALIDRQLPNAVLPDGLVFPPVKMRTRNYELPLIAKAAGITGVVRELSFVGNRVSSTLVDKADAISTHWGRHTFVVHALSMGISPIIVMQWTGHASFDSLKPYIAIADQAKASSMELFNK